MPSTEPKNKRLVVSTAYFAPVAYYSLLLSQEADILVEKQEHYAKQSYRNRCTILSANGLLDLVVPVVKSIEPKKTVGEVEISYDMDWQKQHFKAIESAYRRSPFYEFYIDDLTTFFDCRRRFLYEFNMKILRTVCSLLKISCNIKENDTYIEPSEEGIIDMRNKIHPKIKDAHNAQMPVYTQVFSEKWRFMPNLSILDLLFNVGPESKNFLQHKI